LGIPAGVTRAGELFPGGPSVFRGGVGIVDSVARGPRRFSSCPSLRSHLSIRSFGRPGSGADRDIVDHRHLASGLARLSAALAAAIPVAGSPSAGQKVPIRATGAGGSGGQSASMSRVLVTGGAGFIGSHTVDALIERGYEVRIMDSLQPRVHPRGKPSYLNSQAEFFQGDVTSRDDWQSALEGVNTVFHFAAYQDYLPDFSTFLHVNAISMALLFEIIVAERLPIRKIVYASSQAVAGEGKYRCDRDGVVFPRPRSVAQLEDGCWDVTCPKC